MLYCVASDLHVDTFPTGVLTDDWAGHKNPGSKVLVIAGDTANHYRISFKVIDYARMFYDHVVVLDGNHEHYQTKRPIRLNMRRMKEKAARRPNVTYLDGDNFYRVEDTVFIGCNGWYDWAIMCPEYSVEQQYDVWQNGTRDHNGSNDRHLIFDYGNDARAAVTKLARMHVSKLQRQVEQFSADPTVNNIVVVTHTAPLARLLSTSFLAYNVDPQERMFNGSYANSLYAWVREVPNHKIKHWVFGHTHDRVDRTIDGIRYINNSRGYGSQQASRSPWFLVQADTEVL